MSLHRCVRASGHPDHRIGHAGDAFEIGVEDGLDELAHDVGSCGLIPSRGCCDHTITALNTKAFRASEATTAAAEMANWRIILFLLFVISGMSPVPGRRWSHPGNCANAKNCTPVASFATNLGRVAMCGLLAARRHDHRRAKVTGASLATWASCASISARAAALHSA